MEHTSPKGEGFQPPTMGTLIARTVAPVLLEDMTAVSAPQAPTVSPVDEKVLRECTGVDRWAPSAFVYLEMCDEFSGFGKPPQLVAFVESGEFGRCSPPTAISFRRSWRGPDVDRISSRVSARPHRQDHIPDPARSHH
jgi:hypothetical protein